MVAVAVRLKLPDAGQFARHNVTGPKVVELTGLVKVLLKLVVDAEPPAGAPMFKVTVEGAIQVLLLKLTVRFSVRQQSVALVLPEAGVTLTILGRQLAGGMVTQGETVNL